VLPLIFENDGTEVLQRLLGEYMDPEKGTEGGAFASPAYVSALLQLAKAMLPPPDAVAPPADPAASRKGAPRSLKRPLSSKRAKGDATPAVEEVEVVRLDDDSESAMATPRHTACAKGSPAAAAAAAAALMSEWSCR
jgi:hypothetical protein